VNVLKKVLMDAKEEDIELFNSPVGYPARGVRTQLHRDIEVGTSTQSCLYLKLCYPMQSGG